VQQILRKLEFLVAGFESRRCLCDGVGSSLGDLFLGEVEKDWRSRETDEAYVGLKILVRLTANVE
jgi:hypothetical protein